YHCSLLDRHIWYSFNWSISNSTYSRVRILLILIRYYRKMYLIFIGYCLIALGALFFDIVALPEVISSVALQEGIDEKNDSLNDKAAGIFNCFYSLGAIIAPILGGVLTDS